MLANLLIILEKGKVKGKRAFSNLISVIRQQLLNYIGDPDGSWWEVIKQKNIKY
jgi:hypothetical protein